jgi:sugar lactone lactonase YvrE
MEKIELLVDSKSLVGEGPFWDGSKNLLYWVDIKGSKLHIYNSLLCTNETIQFLQHVCAVVKCSDGELLLAMQHGLYFFNLESKKLTLINNPESDILENRFNDAKCDAAGRFYAGTMDNNELGDTVGSLYCLNNDLSVKKILDHITISNGLAWSLDNKTMYFIDTPTMVVSAFDYKIETGELSNRRTVVRIPEGEGSPDGMTIDCEGMLWVAQWGGWKVSRWNPENGVRMMTIDVPASKVSSCAFGGDNMDELYITTARIMLSAEELLKQPHAGGLFRVKVGIKGMQSHQFKKA